MTQWTLSYLYIFLVVYSFMKSSLWCYRHNWLEEPWANSWATTVTINVALAFDKEFLGSYKRKMFIQSPYFISYSMHKTCQILLINLLCEIFIAHVYILLGIPNDGWYMYLIFTCMRNIYCVNFLNKIHIKFAQICYCLCRTGDYHHWYWSHKQNFHLFFCYKWEQMRNLWAIYVYTVHVYSCFLFWT